MNILVTGSSGRVGSEIARSIADSMPKHQVLGVDVEPGEFTQWVSDLRDHNQLKPLIEQADAIIHCAALHAPHVGSRSEQEFEEINVGVTRALLAFSKPLAPFVLTSSTSIYGHALVADKCLASTQAVWIDEDVMPQPRDIYDKTKQAAEQLVKQAGNEGRSTTSLRMSRCFPEPAREMALYRLHRGVDLRDVVQAHLLALERPAGYAEYVISGPPTFKQADTHALLHKPWPLIQKYFPEATELFQQLDWEPPTSIDRLYSSALAIKELGYRPQYGFVEFMQSLDY